MKQLELNFDATNDDLDFYEEQMRRSELKYAQDNEKEFPVNELDSIILSYQSPTSTGFSILNSEDNSDWFTLLEEFARLLNKADFCIDLDQFDKFVYNLRKSYDCRK